ncbi:MAG: FAD-dependent oxidoreductase [Candidatus Omnitrophota bacterium]
MDEKRENVLILGGGLAGLSSAYHLKKDYALFEKESELGGMARSIAKDGYIFDYDGHLLHFRGEYVFSLLNELLEGNLAPHKRNSWIYSKGSFTRYPFQANLYGLPKDIVKECLVGFINARGEVKAGNVKLNGNFENWIRKTFGDGIAEHFMLPYNRKFWREEPRDITCDWLDGFIPVPSLEDTVTGAISSNTKPYGYNARFWYPIKGGISELVKSFSKTLDNVYLEKHALSIDQYNKKIHFKDKDTRRYERLISSIPLPELISLLNDVPSDIKEAVSMLKYISIYVVNLGIKKDDIVDKHWVYYPEESVDFYRLGFPTNFSTSVAPQGRTSLYAEVSYVEKDAINKEKIVDDVTRSLKKTHIIENESDIETCVPIDIKYGYVVYDKHRTSALDKIKGYLEGFDIHLAGRYGSWRYMSMEDVILDGKETAKKLQDTSKERKWKKDIRSY